VAAAKAQHEADVGALRRRIAELEAELAGQAAGFAVQPRPSV
jgi:hypothetical protein